VRLIPAAELVPGVTFLGRRIRYVQHELTPAGVRTEARDTEPRGLIERLRLLSARGGWYQRLWPAVVEAQNADGSVDVVVGGTWGETSVPLRHGLPGVSVLVQQGQQVLLGYEAGRASQPYAALWKTSGTAKIGSLLVTQSPTTPFAILSVLWFPAGPAGDAAADAAFLAAVPPKFLVPITMGIVST